MKSYNNLYDKLTHIQNLILAWRKARKGKTKKFDVMEFESKLRENLFQLREELVNQTYLPKPLKTFILRDPKSRKISKSAFRDRIVHHALCNIIEPIFERIFIYDSCANRKGKGNLFAINRFYKFLRKITKNNTKSCYVLKADIKHYFQEVNHNILIDTIRRKIKDERVILLIRKILDNGEYKKGVGMPLGNLTSQFFANVYLNELDYLIKHKLKAKFYIRYVDDFVILYSSKEQLEFLKNEIGNFLNDNLKIELHKEKSRIISLSRGIDFVGFRNFYYLKLLRKRNIRKMLFKIKQYKNNEISYEKLLESYQGWQAYAKWADSYNLRKIILNSIIP